jgi:ArsR family transcriptional regulator, arsenate/arsenite/antimonite-responsive transcriptional repressor
MKNTSRLFKALADETRLRILSLLLAGELCVCDLMEVLKLPQSTVSRHLAYLKNAGWVDDRRAGVWMYYSITGNGSDFRNDIIPLLERHLASVPAAASDRQRLTALIPGNRCT